MCGIAAVCLKEKNANAFNIAKQILCSQSSRGTSSTGIAYLANSAILIDKDIVSPSQFAKKTIASGRIVIGHNRMPSVGKVTVENAHPFYNCDGSFAFLHNGSEQTSALRELLVANNHAFLGETDSEVICHFLEELCKYYPIKTALAKLGESYPYSSFLVLTKSGSIFGVGCSVKIIKDNNGIYVGSEEESFNGLFKNQQKTVYTPHGVFEITNGNLIFHDSESNEKIKIGKKEKPVKYSNIEVVEDDDEYGWWKGKVWRR